MTDYPNYTRKAKGTMLSGSSRYIVTDRETGREIKGCFVLRPECDDAAISALRGYIVATENKALAEKLDNWICGIIRRRYDTTGTVRAPEAVQDD